MIFRLSWSAICLLAIMAAFPSAEETPRADISHYTILMEFKPVDNRVEAVADIRFTVQDQTNYILLRLNGNLSVASAEDQNGNPLRFIQDDTDRMELMVNLGKTVEPGTEMTIHLEYAGVFPVSKYDFLRDQGIRSYSYIGNDKVELFASSFWYPRSVNPLDRAGYEIQATLPAGLQPVTSGTLKETVEAGLSKTFIYQTGGEILPPSFLAGRYAVKEVEIDGVALRCLYSNESMELDNFLKAVAGMVKFLREKMGLDPNMTPFQLVEVSEQCQETFGMTGAAFFNSREMTQKTPDPRIIMRRLGYQRWLFPLQYASPEDLWIVEGLSQYMSHLYVLDSKGEEAANNLMRLMAVDALKYADADTIRRGINLGIGTERYNSVVVSKSAWVFHMLRYMITPAAFDQLLSSLATEGARQPLDSTKLAGMAQTISGKDYSWFFTQWVDSVDLPDFSVEFIVYRLSKGGFETVGKINQSLAVFQAPLEIKMVTLGQDEMKTVEVRGETTRLNLNTETRPKQLVLDPNYRILRKSPELEIQVNLVKGDVYLENNDFLSAIEEYKKVVEKEARNSLALYKLATVYYEQFNYTSAQNTFREALNGTQKPEWVVAMCYLYMGKIFDVLGQRERALAEYNKAVNSKDDSMGAVTEAQQYIGTPFTRKKTFLADQEEKKKKEQPQSLEKRDHPRP